MRGSPPFSLFNPAIPAFRPVIPAFLPCHSRFSTPTFQLSTPPSFPRKRESRKARAGWRLGAVVRIRIFRISLSPGLRFSP